MAVDGDACSVEDYILSVKHYEVQNFNTKYRAKMFEVFPIRKKKTIEQSASNTRVRVEQHKSLYYSIQS